MLTLNWQIIWTFVNLLILYFLMKKFLFGRINQMMDQRSKKIKDSLDDAAQKNSQAEGLKKQYEASLHDAHIQATELVSAANEKAQADYDKVLKDAHEDAKRILMEATSSIEQERRKAMDEVKQSIATIALLAAAKVAQQNIDENSNTQFALEFLNEAGASHE